MAEMSESELAKFTSEKRYEFKHYWTIDKITNLVTQVNERDEVLSDVSRYVSGLLQTIIDSSEQPIPHMYVWELLFVLNNCGILAHPDFWVLHGPQKSGPVSMNSIELYPVEGEDDGDEHDTGGEPDSVEHEPTIEDGEDTGDEPGSTEHESMVENTEDNGKQDTGEEPVSTEHESMVENTEDNVKQDTGEEPVSTEQESTVETTEDGEEQDDGEDTGEQPEVETTDDNEKQDTGEEPVSTEQESTVETTEDGEEQDDGEDTAEQPVETTEDGEEQDDGDEKVVICILLDHEQDDGEEQDTAEQPEVETTPKNESGEDKEVGPKNEDCEDKEVGPKNEDCDDEDSGFPRENKEDDETSPETGQTDQTDRGKLLKEHPTPKSTQNRCAHPSTAATDTDILADLADLHEILGAEMVHATTVAVPYIKTVGVDSLRTSSHTVNKCGSSFEKDLDDMLNGLLR
jgi:hypothetical protein